MEGLDLFVKILDFVKILSQWRKRRKKEGRRNFHSLEVQAKAHHTEKPVYITLQMLTDKRQTN